MVEVQVRLRDKNQLTLPEAAVRTLGAAPGDRLIIAIDEDHPGGIELRRLRTSYAGVARGVYGANEQEIAEYLQGERASWGE